MNYRTGGGRMFRKRTKDQLSNSAIPIAISDSNFVLKMNSQVGC